MSTTLSQCQTERAGTRVQPCAKRKFSVPCIHAPKGYVL